jgi:cysteine desulfurase
MRRLYLDHNATCPLRPAAREVLRRGLEAGAGNPSSAHAEGRLARRWIEEARERLAARLDCQRDELVFTSGGTESNATVLGSVPAGRWVLHSPIEHPSVLVPLAGRAHVRALPVDDRGHLDPEALAAGSGAGALRPALVSIGLANHETGVVQDLGPLAERAHALGADLHCDASQAFGKRPLSFRELGVDFLTVSAHKLGGPVGIGALIVRAGRELRPLLRGGEQEGGLRAGTEAAALALAFAAAADEALERLPVDGAMWAAWTTDLRATLRAMEPSVQFNSPEHDGLPNTLNASFPGRSGAALVQRLDLEGVAASHGSACASGSQRPSPVLLALGWPEERARSALRLSVGPSNTDDDLREFPLRLARVLSDVAVRASR